MWVHGHAAGRLMHVTAEALVWNLPLGKEGLSGLSLHQKPPRSRSEEGCGIYPPYSMEVPKIIIGLWMALTTSNSQ